MRLGSWAAVALAACAALHAPRAAAQAQNAGRCTAIDNDAERLACYDRALRPAPATRREREVRESTASAPPAAPAPRRAPEATKEQASDIVPIVIVQIRALPGRAATFVTDQGDTWVQTDTQRQLPDVPFKAAIKPGSMGSAFLVPDDYAHSFRVRRGQ